MSRSESAVIYALQDSGNAGCVRGLFGVTFALGGVFFLAGMAGFIRHMVNGVFLLEACLPIGGGFVMAVLGGLVAFGRGRTFCTTEAIVSEWSLGLWRRTKRTPLAAFSEVRIRRNAGADFSTFVVALWGEQTRRDICHRTTPGDAMTEATRLARAVGMGIRDQSFAEENWHPAEALRQPPWAAFVGAEDPGPPPQGTLRVVSSQHISVPAKGLSAVGTLILGLSGVLFLLGLVPAVLAMVLGGINGELIAGIILPVVVVLPLWGWAFVMPVLRHEWTRQELIVDGPNLLVEHHFLGRTTTQRVLWHALEQVTHTPRDVKRRTAGARLQDGDVCVRAAGLELRLGAGLHSEEQVWLTHWLRHQVARAVEEADLS